jgi:hypothetical protein
MVRELAEDDHLPDHQVALEDNMVFFRNRMSIEAVPAETRYPSLILRLISTLNRSRPATTCTTWNKNGGVGGWRAVYPSWAFPAKRLRAFVSLAISVIQIHDPQIRMSLHSLMRLQERCCKALSAADGIGAS